MGGILEGRFIIFLRLASQKVVGPVEPITIFGLTLPIGRATNE